MAKHSWEPGGPINTPGGGVYYGPICTRCGKVGYVTDREVAQREECPGAKNTFDSADAFQQECKRTSPNGSDLGLCGLGLAGESGEVVEHLKKHLYHNHELDKAAVAKELGDILWYVATLADMLGYKLSQVQAMNVEKLRKRYPNGFRPEDSINRKF